MSTDASGLSLPSGAVPDWVDLDDSVLLKRRLSELTLSVESSPVQSLISRLYEELAAHGLGFRPPCYLATEWLCPDRIPAIGIPFYLAHPRLIRLEKTMMLEAEGESEREAMKLLRHEAGHAINYAYRLFRRTRWRALFGPITARYNPHHYRRRRYSRQYVTHLQDQYAQAHPDEDFAETFAVWCAPDSDWRTRYSGRGALRKLRYVDHLMREIGQTPPPVIADPRQYHWSIARSRATLESYYKTKRKEFSRAYAGFYDPVLVRLFPAQTGDDVEQAWRLLRRHRRAISSEVSRWARIPKYAVHELLSRMIQRAKEMNLPVKDEGAATLLRVGICISALALEAREQYLLALQREGRP